MDKNHYAFEPAKPTDTMSIRERMRAVDQGERRWKKPADAVLHFLTLTMALMIAVYAGMLFERYHTTSGVLSHLGAAPGCPAARLFGVAPSVEGSPGYWRHLDPDHNGVSCEK